MPPVSICDERPQDLRGIDEVLRAAFPTDLESRLVRALREAGHLSLSLVALEGERVVGHIGFSPVTVGEQPLGLGLGPVAVLPEVQGQGIGAGLIEEGLTACRQLKTPCVVVLGEPAYYSRFGFETASKWRLSDDYGGGDVFQALPLQPLQIPEHGGVVQYAPEFGIFE